MFAVKSKPVFAMLWYVSLRTQIRINFSINLCRISNSWEKKQEMKTFHRHVGLIRFRGTATVNIVE